MSEKLDFSVVDGVVVNPDVINLNTSPATGIALQFDHIAQQVPDIAEAVNWYLRLLPGATVLFQDTSWAFVEANGTRLAFVKRDQHPSHLAWRVSNTDLERLATQYQQPIATHRDKTRSFYLEAPGNQWIEIICMESATWAEKPDTIA